MTSSMTATEVATALRSRFGGDDWLSIQEVPNTLGNAVHRYADMIAITTWPSRGLVVHGVEIKTSRSDYRRELRDPEKAEVFHGWCDYWWIAAPRGIVDPATLPETWGLLECSPSRVRTVKQAPRREREPWPHTFAVAALRRAHEAGIATGRREVEAQHQREQDEILQHAEADKERRALVRQAHDAREFLADVGVENLETLGRWRYPELGRAISAVLAGREKTIELARQVTRVATMINSGASDIAAMREALEAVEADARAKRGTS